MHTESTNVALVRHDLAHGMHCENISAGMQTIRYILACNVTSNSALCLPIKSMFMANMVLAITASGVTDGLTYPYRSVVIRESVGAMLTHISQR